MRSFSQFLRLIGKYAKNVLGWALLHLLKTLNKISGSSQLSNMIV